MLSALLVDDERPANERMRKLLAAHGGIEVIGAASSVQEAQAILDKHRPDVVFLDVEMPGATGLELLPSVPRSTQVVFVTAHETYALNAFAVAALDYLVKPVDLERLSETLRRLEQMASLLRLKATITPEPDDQDEGCIDEGADHASTAALGLADTITVPLSEKGRTSVVTIGDICWIEGFRNFTRVGLKAPGRIILFRRRLGEWERELPSNLFERLGKSLVVQAAAIQETEWRSRDETRVTFADDLEPLVIGRSTALRLREILARGTTGLDTAGR
jgi:two-component system LytT family response regulator